MREEWEGVRIPHEGRMGGSEDTASERRGWSEDTA